MRKILPLLCLGTTLAGLQPAFAQQRLVEGILGIGGAIIINEINNRNNRPQPTQRSVDPEAAARAAAAREHMLLVQTRLNAIGFDAGTPDGIAGPRTRNAIRDYQASIGEEATGNLDAEQTALLFEQSAGIGGGGAVATSVGFPSLGTPGAPSTVAPSAFPALGGQAGQPTPASAFPALGAPAAPQPAAGQFPALATPAAPLGSTAFPTLSAPATPAEPAMPLVAGSEQAAEDARQPSSFADEIALTPYASVDLQPAVLGITLDASAEDFAAMLTENDFSACGGEPSAQQCTRQTETLTDTVKGWVDEDGVWAVARLIQFSEPVPADFVRGQFSQSYPELMAAPNGLISSGEACSIAGQRVPQLAAVLDQRQPGEITADLLNVASQCPVAWSLAFNEGNGLVAAVQILMLDGTSVIRQHLADKLSRETQIGADLKF